MENNFIVLWKIILYDSMENNLCPLYLTVDKSQPDPCFCPFTLFQKHTTCSRFAMLDYEFEHQNSTCLSLSLLHLSIQIENFPSLLFTLMTRDRNRQDRPLRTYNKSVYIFFKG